MRGDGFVWGSDGEAQRVEEEGRVSFGGDCWVGC